MPSIFNHESNACWPIRRSYNTLFRNPLNLTDVTEEVHVNKVAYNKEENITNSNYYISSNGYYGYQPHIVPKVVSEECSMDVQENVSIETGGDESMQEVLDFGTVSKRKRNFQEMPSESVKRFRQEESYDLTSTLATPSDPITPTQSLQTYPRCTFEGVTKNEDWVRINSRNIKLKNEDLNFVECMLKETHGCDLYNFDSYDL